MSPVPAPTALAEGSAPRVSGDEPLILPVLQRLLLCSPRERG